MRLLRSVLPGSAAIAAIAGWAVERASDVRIKDRHAYSARTECARGDEALRLLLTGPSTENDERLVAAVTTAMITAAQQARGSAGMVFALLAEDGPVFGSPPSARASAVRERLTQSSPWPEAAVVAARRLRNPSAEDVSVGGVRTLITGTCGLGRTYAPLASRLLVATRGRFSADESAYLASLYGVINDLSFEESSDWSIGQPVIGTPALMTLSSEARAAVILLLLKISLSARPVDVDLAALVVAARRRPGMTPDPAVPLIVERLELPDDAAQLVLEIVAPIAK